MALFKKNWEKESGKSTVFRLAFKVFYAHIMAIVIFVVINMLFVAADSIFKADLTAQKWYLIIINVICLAFYLLDVYIESWRTGARDLNLVNYKHIEYNAAKPILAGFVSQVLGIVGAVAALFDSFAYSGLARRFMSFFYLDFIYPISQANKGEVSKLIYFIPIFFGPIICTAAYHLGYKEIRLLDKIMYKSLDKKSPDGKR